jgi:hypothetical protein
LLKRAVVQLSPIFARPAASLPPATAARPRLAGSTPAVSNIFKRAKNVGSHLVGPGLTAAFAAHDLASGKPAEQVAVETAIFEGASALGAGIGGMVAGPPGAIAGGILAPLGVAVANVVPEKPADIRGFSTTEVLEFAGKPQFGGLSVPAPYEAPGVPNVTSGLFDDVQLEFPAARTTPAAAETSASQPVRDVVAPAARRPAEETRAPISQALPATANPPTQEETRKAVEEEMLTRAAQQQRNEGLIQQLKEVGATKGMSDENARKWVASNTRLAEQLLADRASKEQRLAKQFEGFSSYA